MEGKKAVNVDTRPRRPPRLCEACSNLDLDPLFQAPPPAREARSLKEHEEDQVVWIPDAADFGRQPHRRRACPLCGLIFQCAALADVWKKRGAVYCCIRPVYAWAKRSEASANGNVPPSPVHTGSWHVWFYEKKMEVKLGRPPLVSLRRAWAARPMAKQPFSSRIRMQDGPPRYPATIPPSYHAERINAAIASWTFEAVANKSANLDPSLPWTGRRVPVSGRVRFTELRAWLENCNAQHNHPDVSETSRTRLALALSESRLRAIDTSSGAMTALPVDSKYAVLSYVWGPARSETLPTSQYPSTVRDALELTRKLGIRWLWVDRICIEQDNEDEKLALVSIIKDIFALAELTLVAAAGDGAHCPLPGVSTDRDASDTISELWHGYGTSNLRLLPSPCSLNRLLEPCAWRRRGWTFEEHVFSRRLLYIFPSEVMLSCAKGSFREAYGCEFLPGSAGSTWGERGTRPPAIESQLHAKLNAAAGAVSEPLNVREFVRAVEEYTARDLTFEEDRLKAFAGLITASTASLDPREDNHLILHGHPLQYFETLLTWYYEEEGRAIPISGPDIAPTWSWGSAGAKVHFFDDGQDHSRNDWFRYSLFEGFDILGWPANPSGIPLIVDLHLEPPNETITAARTAAEPPLSYGLQEDADIDSSDLRLPYLRLVTVIFTARFRSLHSGQQQLAAVTDVDHNEALSGWWSLNDPSLYAEVSHQDFAIVGGNTRMYIMLLFAGAAPGTYCREGLWRISLSGYGSGGAIETHNLLHIMEVGHPQWAMITIA